MKIFIYFVGKPKDSHLNGSAEEFVKRTSRFCPCEMREINPNRFDPFEKHASGRKICLDPAGRQMDSWKFSEIFSEAEQVGRDLIFVIGGHDGLLPAWKKNADLLLSLSPMTFPHEMARAMIAEQIYRAYTILRGHPYPR